MNVSDDATIPSLDEVNEILRTQRKGNRKKACFPCYQRKVGCDGSRPCKRCIDRGYPAMCSYKPAESDNRKRKAASMEPATINSAQRTTETASISVSSIPASASRSLSSEQTFTPTDQFVGDSSVPGFIMNSLSRVDERELGMSNNELRNLLLPALGLAQKTGASSTEPEEITSALIRATEVLPRSLEVIRLFQQYKQVVYPFNPHLLDLLTFESELVTFLSSIDQVKSGEATGISLPWTAIMFAVMAAGLQFSDLPSNERASGSKRYVRQAFACLHVESGFITASIPTITAILILVTVLQNDLVTEAAWSYLGLASRLAQSLGLHTNVSQDQSSGDSPESSIWKAIVWQDCLLSMCFGRQPCTSTIRKGHFTGNEAQAQDLDYRSAMYVLASTCLDFIKEDITSPAHLESQASRLQQETNKAKSELRSRDKCRSIEDHIAHLAFRLNTSFALATLLRPSLETEAHWQAHPGEQRKLRGMCIDACVAAVESFVNLHKLSVLAERSWAMLHNGLSCALILLLIDEARSNEKIKQLLQQMVSIMSQSSEGRDQSSLLWGPHARILMAIKLLGSARSSRPSATPPVQGVLTEEQRIISPSSTVANERGEATLSQSNSFFGNNDNNDTINNSNSNDNSTFYEVSDFDLDLSQHSLGTLYDSILWGDYQTL